MTLNPPPGLAGPELDEWQAIAAAPSAHTPLPRLAPDDPAHLGELAAHRIELADLAAPDEHARSLSGSGVLYGPDCSQYQGKPDWRAVRAAGCAIGGYKVSEGRTFLDPSHAWNRAQTIANGLVPLAYHYLYYSDEYASGAALWGRQADWFVDNADPGAIHVLDVEAAATTGHHLGVREWVAQYRRRLPNHPLGVYTNRALWQNRSRMPYDPAQLFDYVWHAGVGNGYYTAAKGTIQAQWTLQGGLVNSLASLGYPTCRLWQITDHAQVPGVGGSFCDGNAFQGSAADLKALITGTGDADMPITDDDAVRIARAVHNQQLFNDQDGKTPITIGYALHTLYRGAGSGDELSPAAVQAVAAALGPVLDSHLAAQAPQIAQAVVAAQGSGPGGQMTAADVEDAVRHVVSQSRITVDTPTG